MPEALCQGLDEDGWQVHGDLEQEPQCCRDESNGMSKTSQISLLPAPVLGFRCLDFVWIFLSSGLKGSQRRAKKGGRRLEEVSPHQMEGMALSAVGEI